jgi:serine/threonine protein kinase
LNQEGGNFVAVKIMKISDFKNSEKKSNEIMNKLKKEIALLKTLNHKNIVQYIDSCITNDNEVSIYMEYMSGGSI